MKHRKNAYLNNRLEQDHRGIKDRTRSMRGFKDFDAAERFCRELDELRNHLRYGSHHNAHVSAAIRRCRFLRKATETRKILEAA